MIVELGLIDAGVARGSRDVAGKSTYDAVAAFDANPIQAPHKAALLRWIHELLQKRIGADLAEEEDEREEKANDALEGANTWTTARAALVSAPNVVERNKELVKLDRLADPIVAVRRERRSRRVEIASRLGLDHPWALSVDGGVATLRALAADILDRTDALARDLQKRVGETPADAIEDAFAKTAQEGWPARLTSRWLEDAFKTIAPRTPKDVALPAALGGASFVRAAADWGFALRVGSTAKSLPFALARDPFPTEAYRYGGLLALAVTSKPFARRKLGLPARAADAHEHTLARTLFFTLRDLAAVTKLGFDADEAEHLSARVYGTPLRSALVVAWANGGISGRKRDDAPARLLGAMRAFALHADLTQQYDEDWFDNPRAAQRLAHVAAGPLWQGDKPGPIDAIVRSFEEALG